MTLLQSMHAPTGGAVAFLFAVALGAISSAASSETTDVPVSQLIVHFAPAAQPRAGEVIGEPKRAELQRLIGQPISVAEPIATGDQIIRLMTPLSRDGANKVLYRLRMQSDVGWAEIDPGPRMRSMAAARRAASSSSHRRTRRWIVTFADPQLAQASRRNEKLGADRDADLTAASQAPLHVVRATVGGAWLVETLAAMDIGSAEDVAAQLEASGLVSYAVPDYPVRLQLLPNDPYFTTTQWSFTGPVTFGIGATQAWDITTGSSSVVVAVLDSGIVPHPDITRVLPGYDFVSSLKTANDGNGRDADPTDPGDWRAAGQCPAPNNSAENSNWHGTLVSGIIAADGNNGVGIAGINWKAQILPVRVLGVCGGDFSDILNGMTWAAGLPVPGVPTNPYPARVINMSFGGQGQCVPQIQALINAVVDAGVFIAVAAGNENADAATDIPGSCLGVTTVAATTRTGTRAGYSNFGARVDIAAPGGDFSPSGASGGIVSTGNLGKTVAAGPGYFLAVGTSFAAPHVAGVASLMLAVNPGLAPAQIKSLMQQSAAPFAASSDCALQAICGAGIVNAFSAVLAAQGGGMAQGATSGVPATVVEFYNASEDHYFITALAQEISDLDNGVHPGWQRTGQQFKAYASSALGLSPVCRFYIPTPGNSHFYSASPTECAQTLAKFPSFTYESPNIFYVALPDTTTGACPAATIPVYRFWDNRADSNHRYTVSSAIRAQMEAMGWIAEGYGPDQVIMCAAQ